MSVESNKSVFISYSSKDRDFVLKLVKDLNENGIKTWVDIEKIRPGENWANSIKNGLKESKIVLIVLSNNYPKSEWVNYELDYALKNKSDKKIIPIKIDNILENIPYNIQQIQYIDFDDNYKEGFN